MYVISFTGIKIYVRSFIDHVLQILSEGGNKITSWNIYITLINNSENRVPSTLTIISCHEETTRTRGFENLEISDSYSDKNSSSRIRVIVQTSKHFFSSIIKFTDICKHGEFKSKFVQDFSSL
jgi:hypothetical protein